MLSGFIEGVRGPQFPIRQLFWFVSRIEVEPWEVERPLVLVIRVEHADGEQLARVDATAMSQPHSVYDPDLPIGLNVLVPLSLEFRRPGRYVVSLSANGEELSTFSLKVTADLPSL